MARQCSAPIPARLLDPAIVAGTRRQGRGPRFHKPLISIDKFLAMAGPSIANKRTADCMYEVLRAPRCCRSPDYPAVPPQSAQRPRLFERGLPGGIASLGSSCRRTSRSCRLRLSPSHHAVAQVVETLAIFRSFGHGPGIAPFPASIPCREVHRAACGVQGQRSTSPACRFEQARPHARSWGGRVAVFHSAGRRRHSPDPGAESAGTPPRRHG